MSTLYKVAIGVSVGAGVIGGTALSMAYEVWRSSKIRDAQRRALHLLHEGYVDVPGRSTSKKQIQWTSVLGESDDPSCLLDKGGVVSPIQLSAVQSTLIAVLDPEFTGGVHFGSDTCFEVKMVVSPKHAIAGLFGSSFDGFDKPSVTLGPRCMKEPLALGSWTVPISRLAQDAVRIDQLLEDYTTLAEVPSKGTSHALPSDEQNHGQNPALGGGSMTPPSVMTVTPVGTGSNSAVAATPAQTSSKIGATGTENVESAPQVLTDSVIQALIQSFAVLIETVSPSEEDGPFAHVAGSHAAGVDALKRLSHDTGHTSIESVCNAMVELTPKAMCDIRPGDQKPIPKPAVRIVLPTLCHAMPRNWAYVGSSSDGVELYSEPDDGRCVSITTVGSPSLVAPPVGVLGFDSLLRQLTAKPSDFCTGVSRPPCTTFTTSRLPADRQLASPSGSSAGAVPASMGLPWMGDEALVRDQLDALYYRARAKAKGV